MWVENTTPIERFSLILAIVSIVSGLDIDQWRPLALGVSIFSEPWRNHDVLLGCDDILRDFNALAALNTNMPIQEFFLMGTVPWQSTRCPRQSMRPSGLSKE